jgi:hypothetical protein
MLYKRNGKANILEVSGNEQKKYAFRKKIEILMKIFLKKFAR